MTTDVLARPASKSQLPLVFGLAVALIALYLFAALIAPVLAAFSVICTIIAIVVEVKSGAFAVMSYWTIAAVAAAGSIWYLVAPAEAYVFCSIYLSIASLATSLVYFAMAGCVEASARQGF